MTKINCIIVSTTKPQANILPFLITQIAKMISLPIIAKIPLVMC